MNTFRIRPGCLGIPCPTFSAGKFRGWGWGWSGSCSYSPQLKAYGERGPVMLTGAVGCREVANDSWVSLDRPHHIVAPLLKRGSPCMILENPYLEVLRNSGL